MSDTGTPVIGHVTPLAGGDTSDRIGKALDMRTVRMMTPIVEPALMMTVETRGHDGLMRPGPASYVEGCPYNECQIRRQCTRPPCGMSRRLQPAPTGVAAISGATPELPEEALLFRTLAAEVDTEDAAWERMKSAREGLETEVANLRAAVDMLQQAAAGHVAEIERLTKERDARAVEVETLVEKCNEERAAAASLRERCLARVDADRDLVVTVERIEAALEIQLCDTAEPASDRLTRIHALTLLRNRAARAKAETLKRWQRRATRAEQRIAALEQERDGLTLRLGERVKGQVQRKATRAKGGRS